MRSGNCTYTPNNLNQYTQAGNVAYLYDSSGNMQYDGHYVYKYDPENRLANSGDTILISGRHSLRVEFRGHDFRGHHTNFGAAFPAR